MAEKKEQIGITVKKDKDFSEWYTQVIQKAGIIDKRYEVKGMFVWMNYGLEAMLNIKRFWDDLFRKHDIKEMYFPLIVPETYCAMNPDWWKGFKDQAFWLKQSGDDTVGHILRPTGEPAMYPMFSLWIRGHRHLPLRIYETVSSFRYETKHTRPLIRDREITLWFEIHTAHATKEDAEEEVKLHEKLFDAIWEKCAIYPLKVRKPQWEVFPGAIGAIEYYSHMPSGRVMENGSINNLGQAYSRKFNVKFLDKDEQEKHVWQVCTGNGARLLAATISIHGDDKGLMMPPEIAPTQVVIVPIYTEETKKKVMQEAKKIKTKLKDLRVHLDEREEQTPGFKFNEWELKGTPLRIEIGPRDIEKNQIVLVRRDTGKKQPVPIKSLVTVIKKDLNEIQKALREKSKADLDKAIIFIKNKKDIPSIVSKGNIAKVNWCGAEKCWHDVTALGEGIELFGTELNAASKEGDCIICSTKTTTIGYIANSY